jgi:hypothetical protein
VRYFLDTEFIENGYEAIHLISLGIVAEDGRTYYAINSNCPLGLANDWVKEHVLPVVKRDWNQFARPRGTIKNELIAFCDGLDIVTAGPPEFWGYYADYDWVVFCQLFGRMIDLPMGWPKLCMDLKQWHIGLGKPELPKQETTEHHALNDAQWNKQVYDFLAAEQAKRVALRR